MNTRIDPQTSRYLAMAAAAPRLDAGEENDLARRARAGDADARTRLITANLRNVVPLALRYRSYGVPVPDLIGEGNLALMKALERFDPERGLRFVTYAKYWVRADMLVLAMRSASMVGGGRGTLQPKFFFRLRREHTRLLGLVGDEQRVAALLAEQFGTTPERIRSVLDRLGARDASLDGTVLPGGGALMDALPAPGASQEDVVGSRDVQLRVRAAIGDATRDFSARERLILEHRLMADAGDALTLADLGARIGVSRERARQIEVGVKQKLRRRLGNFAAAAA